MNQLIHVYHFILVGEQFGDPVLVVTSLGPKKPNTMNFCRVWVRELGLSKFKRVVAWVKGTHEQERNAIVLKG